MPDTNQTVVALAGAGGDLGFRIARALVERGADVRALVRPEIKPEERKRLEGIGLTLVEARQDDRDGLAIACKGAACVVSALNGLAPVILDRQTALLDAAVQAGVPRFISSDYSADFTKTKPGRNRNFDLRRDFMARADRAPIKVTSILNGAFMDMLGAEMPIIQPRIGRVLYWGRADQPLDFTTKDDVAAYTAAAATDPATPRILRIAGDSLDARGLASAMTAATGKRFKTLRVGGMGMLGAMIRIAKLFGPTDAVFAPFQGIQYMRDMFSGQGKLTPLDNARYPDLTWTTVPKLLAGQAARRSAVADAG